MPPSVREKHQHEGTAGWGELPEWGEDRQVASSEGNSSTAQADPTFDNKALAFPRPVLLDPEAKGEAEKQTRGTNSQPGPETAKARPTAAFEALGGAMQS